MTSDKLGDLQGLGFPAFDERTHANTSVQNSQAESQNLYFAEATSCLCVRDQLVEIGRLNWKKVDTSDGVTIGELQGADVDTKSWQVTHVHIGLNDKTIKEFGLRKPYLGRVLICLPVDTIRAVNEIIVLKKTFSELKTNKECTEFSGK